MKVVFMGTPDFAVGILEAIVNSRHEVVLAVTQEDKPKGRSDKLLPPPVKEYALEHGIPVFQPHRIKEKESVDELRKYEADIYVVAAFGQILSEEILNIPRYGCINTHASLLPKYRGAAPIQWAIVDGEAKTGVTIMQMDKGLDTGDILYTSVVEISASDTGESLFDKLAVSGASLIIEALDRIEAGDCNPKKQDESKATYAKILNKKMGCIDFTKKAIEIERLIRGFTPWPGTYTYYNGKLLKVFSAVVQSEQYPEYKPGDVVCVEDNRLLVKTGEGVLVIDEVQLEGKKRMMVSDFVRGYRIKVGDHLG